MASAYFTVLSAAERRGTPILLSASVSDNFGNSPREIDQPTQRFYVGWFHVGWQGIGDQSDAVTQNAWFVAHCAAISGKISILIQTRAESWGRVPVPRICRWESNYTDIKCALGSPSFYCKCIVWAYSSKKYTNSLFICDPPPTQPDLTDKCNVNCFLIV